MREGSCIHFNGLINDTCRKGYNYLEVAEPLTQEQIDWHNKNYPNQPMERTAIGKRIPCLAKNKCGFCSDYLEPTVEQLEQQEKEIQRIIERVNIAYLAILDYIKRSNKEGSDWSSQIDCPICEVGILSFSYAGSYNGHIHGKCSTTDCVEWME